MINFKQAKKYCKEELSKIKNYDLAIADKTQTWHLHHMTETWWNCSAKELIENECYYNRKACELIFLTPAEHRRLHQNGYKYSEESRIKMSEAKKGKKFSEEHCKNMSASLKGRNAWNKGKHNIYSEETLKKMSKIHKGRRTKGATGMHWYNNGIVNKVSYECPEGFVEGRLK